MRLLKKHLAIFLILPIVIGIGFLNINIYASKDNGTMYLKDHKGDRSVLQDITIEGELRDVFHSTSFKLEKSELKTDTLIYSYPNDMPYGLYYIPGRPLTMNGVAYEVMGNRTFDIYERNIENSLVTNSPSQSTVSTNVMSRFYTNQLEYGLTEIDGTPYFTVVLDESHAGENGIYTKSSQSFIWDIVKYYRFEENQDPDTSNIAVLGLESVGDTLVLILKNENNLSVKTYSTVGFELGETTLPNFFEEQNDSSFKEYPYEAFPNDDEMLLTLSFQTNSAPLQRDIVTIDFSEGAEVIDVVELLLDEITLNTVTEPTSKMLYKNNKLFIAKTVRDDRPSMRNLNQIARPVYFVIYVYEDGKLIYQGELVSDFNDDILLYKTDSTTPGPSSNGVQLRNFVNVTIE
ncbi:MULTISPECIES: hypothetical protein [Bacillaceae]|uniref:Uncharacterized protein n=1 Tax=Evansella alkalicola TaxID=745819 RepID=A0ABS6JN72_9BACI|nr:MULTISPECIES: hypothetical protein [Bacillaceae]MBU9720006.1 hypothetical protein [Bacillus alkalicola]